MKEFYWYLRSSQEVLDELDTTADGLSQESATKRLERDGRNELESQDEFKPLEVLFEKANTLIVYILFATALLSLFADHHIEFYVILVIIGFTVLFSWFQEYQAAQSVQALKDFTAKQITVLRDNKQQEIDSRDLVAGDVVVLTRGMIVPADMRVLQANGLRVDESILTGESLQKPKHAKRIDEQDVALTDQHNILFSGTSITTGSGRGVVIRTGQESAIGKISKSLKEIGSQQTPLQKKVDLMSQRISYLVLTVAAFFFLILLSQSQPVFAALILVGALAVSGIPEGFPLVLTIALTHGVKRMAKKNAIVKDMSSVETLGSATVICTDKTGTLTQNRMRVTKIVFPSQEPIQVSGIGYEPIATFQSQDKEVAASSLGHKAFFHASVFCNDASLNRQGGEWVLEGEPTEGALLALAKAADYDEEVLREDNARVDEIPFDPDNKYMVVAANKHAYMKGAYEKVLSMCTHVRINDRRYKLTKKRREELTEQIKSISQGKLRVLAIASKTHKKSDSLTSDFVFEGIVGIEDPVRENAKQAIDACKTAGIDVIMITGDHVSTAASIAEELGIIHDNRSEVMSGEELDKLSDEDLDKHIESIAVFARTTPDHKLRIVRSLKRNQEVVAMTGDGVNDAPALKQADLGISMGNKGTEVARQASNLVLADDNFKTIVDAVQEGRTIYSNIRRFIFYLLTANFTEVATIVLGVMLGLQAPLTALLVLFINLLTNVIPALALAIEPTKQKVMTYRPRDPSERLLSRYVLTKIGVLIPLLVGSVLSMFYYYHYILAVDLVYAQTVVFALIVSFEVFHVFNARSLHTSIFSNRFFSNKYIFITIAIAFGLTLCAIYVPSLQVLFSTVPLAVVDWVRIIAVASTVVIYSELMKLMTHAEMREQAQLHGFSEYTVKRH